MSPAAVWRREMRMPAASQTASSFVTGSPDYSETTNGRARRSIRFQRTAKPKMAIKARVGYHQKPVEMQVSEEENSAWPTTHA